MRHVNHLARKAPPPKKKKKPKKPKKPVFKYFFGHLGPRDADDEFDFDDEFQDAFDDAPLYTRSFDDDDDDFEVEDADE